MLRQTAALDTTPVDVTRRHVISDLQAKLVFLQEATHNIRAKDEGPERAQEAANVRDSAKDSILLRKTTDYNSKNSVSSAEDE